MYNTYLYYLKLYYPDYSILNLDTYDLNQESMERFIRACKGKKEMVILRLPSTNKFITPTEGVVIIGENGMYHCCDFVFCVEPIEDVLKELKK